ncbi:SDR family oxidoreductase [Sphingomonas cannabina]|uniref:SDR family NAD(P)-dependent oxidoreductase n=1 Tax=Sphingomonas cannabina TaxID=2899123 RepID=UPI001F29DBFA|nr:SDR family oxidoreductase [Sphingomonas cannabina]UIJ46403.1 SDR family oxidoreductase [Sphingomonas cannabina]
MTKALNETALVTGASTGIGAVYADRLARRGYDLILVARDAARMEALAERLRAETGRTVEVLRADLTDRTDLAAVEARLASDPSVTLLINNAGKSMKGTLLDAEPAEIDDIVALNITAPTRLAGAAVKTFAARKTGAIVNIASVLALAPEFYDGVYSGSKAHLLNLSLSLAHQLKDQGVYVQAVLPGATRTEIWERSGKDVDSFPPDFVMDVHDLVDAALIGFDRREGVTIPPLADETDWTVMNDARLAMQSRLSRSEVAPRYREAVSA